LSEVAVGRLRDGRAVERDVASGHGPSLAPSRRPGFVRGRRPLLTSPLEGEVAPKGRVGGGSFTVGCAVTPHLNPPPQGGRGQETPAACYGLTLRTAKMVQRPAAAGGIGTGSCS